MKILRLTVTTSQSNTTPAKQQQNSTTTTPQRVQIMRTPDGRLTVKGLMPGQQLIQTSDGKLQVVTTTQIQQQSKTTAQSTPVKAVVKTTNATSTPGKNDFLKRACVRINAITITYMIFLFGVEFPN